MNLRNIFILKSTVKADPLLSRNIKLICRTDFYYYFCCLIYY